MKELEGVSISVNRTENGKVTEQKAVTVYCDPYAGKVYVHTNSGVGLDAWKVTTFTVSEFVELIEKATEAKMQSALEEKA